ncbi:MAG: hypothetical protein QF437_05840 [Planctomycetota bacterium]|jgi:hypothetical protein|nr:hypothetical protein [Planctomycetota bacterium]MDP7129988.1 hypothetical protein [Planctomycetota bacterium]MDP7251576.1 hypothetical protein [Planctomycetota bacterium]
MSTCALSVEVPVPLFEELAKRAIQSQRTVAEEIVDVLVSAVQTDDKLPAYLEEKLNALHQLDDEALWETARDHLPKESSEKLEELSYKRQAEGLTEEETELQAELVRDYEWYMLSRSKAAFLLRERGHDISSLNPSS